MADQDLDAILRRLAELTPAAQQRWKAQRHDEDDEDDEEEEEREFSGDEPLWFQLVNEPMSGWMCGYACQPDEATEWAIYAGGQSLLEAATKLLREMEE